MQVEFVFDSILSQNDDIKTHTKLNNDKKILFYIIKVEFIHIECFLIFCKCHFLLKNNSSPISVIRALSSGFVLSLQMDYNHQKLVGIYQQRYDEDWRRVQSTLVPLAP